MEGALAAIERVFQGVVDSPQTFLQRALKNQGLDNIPARMKEVWLEGDYKYTVRIHEGDPMYTEAKSIYRVARKKVIKGANNQGSGLEYLGVDGNWYHESLLKEFYKNGNRNPLFNEEAAKLTHIFIGGN